MRDQNRVMVLRILFHRSGVCGHSGNALMGINPKLPVHPLRHGEEVGGRLRRLHPCHRLGRSIAQVQPVQRKIEWQNERGISVDGKSAFCWEFNRFLSQPDGKPDILMPIHLYVVLVVIDEQEPRAAVCTDRVPQRMSIFRSDGLRALRQDCCHRRQPLPEPVEEIMQRPQQVGRITDLAKFTERSLKIVGNSGRGALIQIACFPHWIRTAMEHIVADKIAPARNLHQAHRHHALRLNLEPRQIPGLHASAHLTAGKRIFGFGIWRIEFAGFGRFIVIIHEYILRGRLLVWILLADAPRRIGVPAVQRKHLILQQWRSPPARTGVNRRNHSRFYSILLKQAHMLRPSFASNSAAQVFIPLLRSQLPQGRSGIKFVLQLNANHRPSVLEHLARCLRSNLLEQTADIMQVAFVIGAHIKGTPEQPVRQSAVADLAMAERTHTQDDIHSILCTQLYESP
ncbi:hypothetical protein D3C73_757730 [compost metagenome]